ncbi:MAG: hypothetical protein U5K51_06635 [Flavobacteriaceae bacterium]|nr:hypothetical protein [Flavobacteriaceae bacterium]
MGNLILKQETIRLEPEGIY